LQRDVNIGGLSPVPYGNALAYQIGDPGRFKFSKRFRHRFRGLGRVLRGAAGFIPGPVGQIASLMGDPGMKGTKHMTRHRAKKAARHASKSHPGGHRAASILKGALSAGRFALTQAGQIPALQPFLPPALATAVGAGGETPTLEEASAATGLPTSHPLTKQAHRAMGGRHRRINPANVHALRRANRRLTGFVKLYRRTARHLGYTLHRGPARASGRFGRKK
jgi:hypothetical protein